MARDDHDTSFGHANNLLQRIYELDQLWQTLEDIAPRLQTLRAQLYLSAVTGQDRMDARLVEDITNFFAPTGEFSMMLDFMLRNDLPLQEPRKIA